MENVGWDALTEAIQIFKKADPDVHYPFHCEHDILYVLVDPDKVIQEEKDRLKELGFEDGNEPDEDGNVSGEYEGMFYSFRFGSS